MKEHNFCPELKVFLKKYYLIVSRDTVEYTKYSKFNELDTIVGYVQVIFDEIKINGKVFHGLFYEIASRIDLNIDEYDFYRSGWQEYSFQVTNNSYFNDDHPILMTTDDKKEFLKWKLMIS